MSTAPVKPQPLHNFPLSLKWGQTTGAIHHHRATTSSIALDSETESDPDQPPIRHHHTTTSTRVGSRSARVHRFSFTSCSTLLSKSKNPLTETDVPERPLMKVSVLERKDNGGPDNEEEEEKKQQEEEEEGNSRPWKLRPRRGTLGAKNGGELKETMAVHVNEHNKGKERDNTTQLQPKSMRLRGLVESAGGGAAAGICVERKEKRKFWIALSREEIEEDVFALTGSRPARRPRKRPKNVQKLLDNVFPGLWLVGTTADSYRVADPPVKQLEERLPDLPMPQFEASLYRWGAELKASSLLTKLDNQIRDEVES